MGAFIYRLRFSTYGLFLWRRYNSTILKKIWSRIHKVY